MKQDSIYLTHILECVDDIEEFCEEGRNAFFADKRTQAAVIRKFEIIGEAVKRLSENLRNSRPDISWREIAGFRDILIHNYMGVDLELVWEIVQRNLPALRKAVVDLLESTR